MNSTENDFQPNKETGGLDEAATYKKVLLDQYVMASHNRCVPLIDW